MTLFNDIEFLSAHVGLTQKATLVEATMKKTLIASLGAIGIVLLSAVIALSTVPTEVIPAATAAGYSQAHVLQPGSRGTVVEI